MTAADPRNPGASAAWLLEELEKESLLQPGVTFISDTDRKQLLGRVQDAFGPGGANDFDRSKHTAFVHLLRSAIVRSKERGDPCIKVRRGVRVPVVWEDHYECIFNTNHNVYISAVMQSVFLGNPLAGERGHWKTR